MQFVTLSVRFILISILTCIFSAFRPAPTTTFPAAMLEGKWECGSKSGNLDEFTSYQLNCAGDVHFKADHSVESTTTDAFLPTGSKWTVEQAKLVLRDSYGSVVVDFEIKSLGTNQLTISRKGIEYGFNRSGH